jgi:DNA-binding beta-propeller fold protein YncE
MTANASQVIKLKRSETSGVLPTVGNLEIGEIALNIVDKVLYTKDSGGNIVSVANFAVADQTLIFPTGDYGSLTSPSTDAFGVPTSVSFDCKTTPAGTLGYQDLGVLT